MYTYDAIGNMTSKAGVNYTYGPTNSDSHQTRNVSGQTYGYDAADGLMQVYSVRSAPAATTPHPAAR
jgi:hypothetical protein